MNSCDIEIFVMRGEERSVLASTSKRSKQSTSKDQCQPLQTHVSNVFLKLMLLDVFAAGKQLYLLVQTLSCWSEIKHLPPPHLTGQQIKTGLTEPFVRRMFGEIFAGSIAVIAKSNPYRNLKLDHILIDSEGRMQIAGFIFSLPALRRIYEKSVYRRTPERLALRDAKKEVLWCLGVILFTIANGYPPFFGATLQQILCSIKDGRKFKFLKHVSKDFKDLVTRMLTMQSDLMVDDIAMHPWVFCGTVLRRETELGKGSSSMMNSKRLGSGFLMMEEETNRTSKHSATRNLPNTNQLIFPLPQFAKSCCEYCGRISQAPKANVREEIPPEAWCPEQQSSAWNDVSTQTSERLRKISERSIQTSPFWNVMLRDDVFRNAPEDTPQTSEVDSASIASTISAIFQTIESTCSSYNIQPHLPFERVAIDVTNRPADLQINLSRSRRFWNPLRRKRKNNPKFKGLSWRNVAEGTSIAERHPGHQENTASLHDNPDFSFLHTIRLLYSNIAQVRSLAGTALAMFSFNSVIQQKKIADCGGVRWDNFAPFLQSEDDRAAISAAFQVVVLSRIIPDREPALSAADGIKTMIDRLEKTSSEEVKGYAADCIARLAHTRAGVPSAMVAINVVPLLCQLLNLRNNQVRGSAAVALGYLSFDHTAERVMLRICRDHPNLIHALNYYTKNCKLSPAFLEGWKHCVHVGLPNTPSKEDWTNFIQNLTQSIANIFIKNPKELEPHFLALAEEPSAGRTHSHQQSSRASQVLASIRDDSSQLHGRSSHHSSRFTVHFAMKAHANMSSKLSNSLSAPSISQQS